MNKFLSYAMAISTVMICQSQLSHAVPYDQYLKHQGLPHHSGTKGQWLTSKVLEVAEGGGYSFFKIEQNGEQIWAATLKMSLATGTEIWFRQPLTMTNFFSKTLNRTFDKILFVSEVKKVNPEL